MMPILRTSTRPVESHARATGQVWIRLLRSLAYLILIGMPLAALLIGCSNPQQRYRVLSTFFDGVPVPEGMEDPNPQTIIGPWGKRIPINSPEAQAFLAEQQRNETRRQREQVEVAATFYHKPYEQRNCFGCHDQTSSYQTMEAGSDSCRNCHADYFVLAPGDWQHGPLAVDECNLCHLPHKSEHAGLLTQPQQDLCFTCHDRGYIENDIYHSGIEDLTCSRCHDPHSAGNRKLLVDSRSYQRRSYKMPRKTSEHTAWTKDDCSLCHRMNESNVLVENVDAVCQSCHAEQMVAPAGEKMHQAVVDGKCTSCHAAHQSTLPKLVLPSAEGFCYRCHDPAQIQTPNHPKVVRADCTQCHMGHSSPRASLLRDGITYQPQVAQDMKPVHEDFKRKDVDELSDQALLPTSEQRTGGGAP